MHRVPQSQENFLSGCRWQEPALPLLLPPATMPALPPACSSMDVSAEKPFSPVTPWPPFPTALQFAEAGWLHLTHATSLGNLQSL